MMKKNSTMISLVVFVIAFIIIILGFVIYNSLNKKTYSCIDYSSNTTYTFDNEEEMHEVCDKFNGVEEDKIIDSYTIYNDLINENNDSFTLYPYVNSDKKLSIIITIIDCDNPNTAKEKAIKWFHDHSYNINDFTIEYEYPCEQ